MKIFYKQLLILIMTVCMSIFIYNRRISQNSDFLKPREFQLHTPGCKIPYLDLYHPTILSCMKNNSNLEFNCSATQIFFMDGNILKINFQEMKKLTDVYDNVTCTYVPIIHDTAWFQFQYPSQPQPKHIIADTVINDEFIMVECSSSLKQIHQDFFASILRKEDVERRCNIKSKMNSDENRFKVLLLGVDSTSRNNFYRQFPRTAEFIHQNLTYADFHGYNKLGSTTFPNLIPLLTGKLHNDFTSDFSHVDMNTLPMIWKKFSLRGYRTLFAEDIPQMSAFIWSKRPFILPPTDYYMSPMTLAVENSNVKDLLRDGCYVNRTETYAVLKWSLEFFDEFKNDPVFAFVYLSRHTHNSFKVAPHVDRELLKFLRQLYSNGYLENTIVFFYGDHGHQLSGVRLTYQGNLEEKLPFLFILMPKSFPNRYPDFYRNVKLNEQRLVTLFDVHATLEDIVNGFHNERNINDDGHHVSLFTPISDKRTCQTVHIDALFCTCQGKHRVAINTANAKHLALLLVNSLNERLVGFEKLCSTLKLSQIIDIIAYYNKTSHLITNEVTLQVKPSGGIFRGIIFVDELNNIYSSGSNIDRINIYGSQSHCVKKRHLMPICFCKE